MTQTPELNLSPLTAAVAASQQFREFCAKSPAAPLSATGNHPFLDALAAFMASPQGQALEAALINLLLTMISKTN